MKRIWSRLLALRHRDALDRDYDDEAAAHLELATDDYIRRGLPPDEARRRARLDFGSADAAKVAHREARGLGWVEALVFDVRLAWRGLRRDWRAAFAAVAMLTLGLTLHTVVFTVTGAMLWRGFPHVPRSHELVFLQEHDRLGRCCLSYADVADWQAQAPSFQGIAPVGGTAMAFRDPTGRSMDLRVTTVGANLFELLGVPPALGRTFTADDGVAGARPVVLLSDRIWRARFGGRPEVVGSVVQADGTPAEIIGVMPPGFEFPLAADDGLWMPIGPAASLPRGLSAGAFTAIARLRDGVTLARARAELEAVNRGLELAHGDVNRGIVPSVVDHAQWTSGADARVIWGSLWAASAVVLLIACANVANLTVLRTFGRWHQFATCLALGAGRTRIVRQLAIDGVLLTMAAAIPVWPLTQWAVQEWAARTASRYQAIDYAITAETVAYLAGAALVTAALASLAPIVRVLRLTPADTLQASARASTNGRGTRRLVTSLVAAQVALTLVLLTAAGVLVRSFVNITSAVTGVQAPESVAVGLLRLPSERYPTPEARLTLLSRVEAALADVGGVAQVAFSNGLPVKFAGASRALEAEGRPGLDAHPTFSVTTTTPGYFALLGVAVITGRDFTASDDGPSRQVAIVNERFAAVQWPGESAVGQRVRAVERDGPGPWRVVVGVVANVMGADALRQQFQPLVYVPLLQQPPPRSAFFLVRTHGPADRLSRLVRTTVHDLDRDIALDYEGTLATTFAFDRDFMDAEHSELGKYAKVAPAFALVALLLAATGLVAVVGHAVAQRTREIGVRVAIGASAGSIRRLVVADALRPVALGLTLGALAASAVTRLFTSQLVGVSPSDPLSMLGATALLLSTALLACRVPIRRALQVDPAVVLRHE